MPAPLSITNNSSFQTARYNNQALSMGPLRPHTRINEFRNSVKYLNISNHCTYMQTEENERGEYLDTRIWKLLEINRKTDSRGRIHVNEINYGKEIKVFISDLDQELETCKKYALLPHSMYTEIRKTRVKDQIGEPLKVQKNGDVWTTQKEKFVKIFVKEESE